MSGKEERDESEAYIMSCTFVYLVVIVKIKMNHYKKSRVQPVFGDKRSVYGAYCKSSWKIENKGVTALRKH